MNDRELLEAAAKAAGLTIEYWAQDDYPVVRDSSANVGWNPLTFDSDALRLAVKLRLHVDHHRSGVSAWVISLQSNTAMASHYDEDTGDDCADTRRAIVRAAAAIGMASGAK